VTDGLTPEEQQRFDTLYGGQPTEAAPTSPGAFAGAWRGLGGIPSGLAAVPLDLASATTATPQLSDAYVASLGVDPKQYQAMSDDFFASTWQAAVHRPIEDLRQTTAEYWRPDPHTTGFVGNTLFGATDVLTRVGLGNLIAPGAGIGIAAATTGGERTSDLEQQGVDQGTALQSGVLTGASLAAAGGVSAFGKTIAQRAITGAATNVAFGAGTRAMDSHILAAAGYQAQAEQQKWNDGAALVADAVIGGAFHLLPHGSPEAPAKPAADQVDAALAAKSAQQVTDAAPGVPADPRAASAHVAAMDTAEAQLTDGQPVEVEPLVRDQAFVDRPGQPAPAERTMQDIGSIIDNRLAALDQTAGKAMPPDQVRSLAQEAGDLEDLLRQQYRARDQGVIQSADTGLTPDEVSFAEQRLTEIRQQLEQHKLGQAARSQADRLRTRLGKTDTDAELRAIAEQIAPQTTAETAARQSMREAMVDSGVPEDAITKAETPTPEQAFQQRLANEPDQLFAEYAALPDSMGGVVLNTDVARELSPHYLADRTRSADVHEPASETIKQLYAKKLAEPTPEGMDPVVMFTAGGTGAGKSRSLSTETQSAGLRPEIVYDTNMNTYASAEKKVQQALDAGRQVRILYVYRDPVDALVNGALPRAERQALKYGTGRTVPLSEHARTHIGVRDVMERLAEKYAGDERVQIVARDNSGMPDKDPIRALADLPRPEQNGLHEKLAAALDAEHRAGRISDATRAGFEVPGRDGLVRAVRGEPSPQRPAGARGRPGDAAALGASQPDARGVGQDAAAGNPEAGTRSPSGLTPPRADLASSGPGGIPANEGAATAQPRSGAPNDQGQSGARLDPARDGEVARAREAAAQSPDLILDDGQTVAEALRAADEDVTQAEQTGSAIRAAVACFLRFGADA
jgi:hypothetical protein